MKLYIVMFHTWEEDIFLGVFSSPDKVKSYIENKYPKYEFDNEKECWVNHDGDTIDIEEAILNDENQHLRRYLQ